MSFVSDRVDSYLYKSYLADGAGRDQLWDKGYHRTVQVLDSCVQPAASLLKTVGSLAASVLPRSWMERILPETSAETEEPETPKPVKKSKLQDDAERIVHYATLFPQDLNRLCEIIYHKKAKKFPPDLVRKMVHWLALANLP